MNYKQACILFGLLCLLHTAATSQSKPGMQKAARDSTKAANIDSLVQAVHATLQSPGHLFIDTVVNGMRIYMGGGQAANIIYYFPTHGYEVVLYGQNGSLVLASHKVSAPDIRSMPPPSITHTYYYTNDTVFKTGMRHGGYGEAIIPLNIFTTPGTGTEYPAQYRQYKKLLAPKWKRLKANP